MDAKQTPVTRGERAYETWRDRFFADPESRRVYDEEAAKSELWLQLVEARMAAGLTQTELARRLGVTQSQVARIEKRGYESYTLNTLRHYVDALGEGFSVEVKIHRPDDARLAAGRGTVPVSK